MKPNYYPFSALIGQDSMKTALILNAVDPAIGGVLISGHKGTGKSTAVRALARILPDIDTIEACPFRCAPQDPAAMCAQCRQRQAQGDLLPVRTRRMPLVELPLSATEDRVVGTLHIEEALKTGRRRFEPGLLAAANRGILYVDEVNLLEDHLVDILLDAASSGINIVEREGLSHLHPARFMLIGTMNPEEGDLRPQFLDRFGLSLAVRGIEDQRLRRAIVRQRLAFDQQPEPFIQQWAPAEKMLADQIGHARATLNQVKISADALELAVRLCIEVGVQGHRADIAMLKTARALAAMTECARVERPHIAEAARLVLPHRMTNVPLATPEALLEKLEAVLAEHLAPESSAAATTGTDDSDPFDLMDEVLTTVPGPTAASNSDMIFSFLEKKKLFLTATN